MESTTLIINNNSFLLYPERGGIITSLQLRGIEILYQGMLDATLKDPSKSVKGGIPILFPNAGPLIAHEKSRSGYNLPQHGFARTNAWKVIRREDNHFIQRLDYQDVQDNGGYIWQGTMTNTIVLPDDSSCDLDYMITNEGENPIPISFGLHPYFDVPEGDKKAIQWNFKGGDQIAQEVETWSNDGTTKIDMPQDGILRVYIPGIGNLRIDAEKEFKRLWIWSLPGKNFVCIEPVMGDEGAIVNNPPVMLQSGRYMKTGIRISLED